ncbi:YlbD family protein [Bacillus pseudomycoides]|uniref:YlbD family protein n=1 Tax=Bacillus pseudomycoides TaxID=64104 RepID=UPI000BEBF1B5|nr:YlbD family protein [Bacillus pseudomycoides]PEE42123.1 cytoplasmic protein [Bacillus pseudomycoides]PEI91784.1 cytoplasmic protein [Bacillus pseudomycoides]PGA91976.1 cytoplasmic protein [Bacillus pseudomycoides]PHF50447.1 cytoplasmic protein [Bacillus pseudomycoides]
MTKTKGPLHPSVQQFKEFVNHHPKMVHEVRNGEKTWQQFYEEWYLLGEQDEVWKAYKADGETISSPAQENNDEKAVDLMGQMLSFLKKLDAEQMQQHLANVTSAIGSVQQVIQQFQENRTQPEQRTSENNPFFFRKD